jgi:hypothetical protein
MDCIAGRLMRRVLLAGMCVLSACQAGPEGPSPGAFPGPQVAGSAAQRASPGTAARQPDPTPQPQSPDITLPHGSLIQAQGDANEGTSLPGGPVRISLSRQMGDVQIVLKNKLNSFVVPRSGATDPVAPRPGRDGDPTATTHAAPTTTTAPLSELSMRNGRVRLKAVDVTASDAAASQDSLDLEASWQDDQGNTFAVRCTKVIPGGMSRPVFGGVVTNHLLERSAAPDATDLPAGYAYVAFWGTGDVLKNGQVQDSDVVIQGMLTEAAPGQHNHPPLADPLVAARLRLHVLAGPLALNRGLYVRRPAKTGCVLADGKPLTFWHVTFDHLSIQSERNTPIRRHQNRTSLALWTNEGS